MAKFVVHGAKLKCTMGSSSGSLTVKSTKVKGCSSPMANKLDCTMKNIPSFGICKITKVSCVPATIPWNTSSTVNVRGAPAVNASCSIECACSGKITVSDPGQTIDENS